MMKLPQCSITSREQLTCVATLGSSGSDLATDRVHTLGKVKRPDLKKEQHQPEKGVITTLMHSSEHEVCNSVLLLCKKLYIRRVLQRLKGTSKPTRLSPVRINLLPVNWYLLLQRPLNGLVLEIRF